MRGKKSTIDPRILHAAKQVTAKRPKTVIDHILKHGHITTQDLERKYGYNHPPRAARDVREAGIPLETFRVTGRDGRRIAAYRFGDPAQIEHHKLAGRRVFSKKLKERLYSRSRGRCDVCQTPYENRFLQIDHRVPYEVAGDSAAGEEAIERFMLLCGSCQRSKSWTCEHCSNWKETKDPKICNTCYWAAVEDHTHVAGQPIRRLDVSWVGPEVATYEALRKRARAQSKTVSQLVKETMGRHDR
jgi:hypothetical protein